MSELLNCPFCGGKGVPRNAEAYNRWSVSCDSCWVTVDSQWSEAAATDKWNRRTPQPGTPAGGEVVLTGWTKADGKTLWMEHDGLPVFNEGKHDDLGTNKAIHLYTHPPVADAALAELNRPVPAKSYTAMEAAMLALSGLAEQFDEMAWAASRDGESERRDVWRAAASQARSRAKDPAWIAALNQRGGGHHG